MKIMRNDIINTIGQSTDCFQCTSNQLINVIHTHRALFINYDNASFETGHSIK